MLTRRPLPPSRSRIPLPPCPHAPLPLPLPLTTWPPAPPQASSRCQPSKEWFFCRGYFQQSSNSFVAYSPAEMGGYARNRVWGMGGWGNRRARLQQDQNGAGQNGRVHERVDNGRMGHVRVREEPRTPHPSALMPPSHPYLAYPPLPSPPLPAIPKPQPRLPPGKASPPHRR